MGSTTSKFLNRFSGSKLDDGRELSPQLHLSGLPLAGPHWGNNGFGLVLVEVTYGVQSWRLVSPERGLDGLSLCLHGLLLVVVDNEILVSER